MLKTQLKEAEAGLDVTSVLLAREQVGGAGSKTKTNGFYRLLPAGQGGGTEGDAVQQSVRQDAVAGAGERDDCRAAAGLDHQVASC